MKQLNIAVIGCGRMGKMHILNIKQFLPCIDIQAVVDPNPDTAWLENMQICNIYQSMDPVLSSGHIQAVLIAAPSSEHVRLIQQAAAAKKHIFCEKPISFDIEALQQAKSAVLKNGVKMQVGFNRRFDPSISALKHQFETGKLGKLYSVRITNRDPKRPNIAFIPNSGGLFLDFNVHDFDTLRFITGQEIELVQAFGSNLIDPAIGQLGDIDTCIITCQLLGQGVASIDASREAVYGYDQRVELLGSLGSATVEHQPQSTVSKLMRDQTIADPLKTSFVERYAEAYRHQMQAFFNYVQDPHAKSPVSGDDCLRAVACAIAAERSMKQQRAVFLHEIL